MSTSVATHEPVRSPAVHHDTSVMALMMDGTNMDRMVRMSELMASGKSTVPAHLRGNAGDCMAVTMQAMQWGMNPYAVAQKTHLVNGTLGYEGQLVAAVVNNSPLMQDRLAYEWFGDWEKIIGQFKEVTSTKKLDDNGQPKKYIVPAWNLADEKGLGIRVRGTVKGEAAPRVLELLMTQCRTRNSGLWTEDPKQQIAYLAARRWARLHTPDVLLGVYTPDELEERSPVDMGAVVLADEDAASLWTQAQLSAGKSAAGKGASAYMKFWKDLSEDDRSRLHKTPEHARFKDDALIADKNRTIDTAPASAATTAGETPAKSFAQVMEMLVHAATMDELDDAADWIGDIADEVQRRELKEKRDARAREMEGGAA